MPADLSRSDHSIVGRSMPDEELHLRARLQEQTQPDWVKWLNGTRLAQWLVRVVEGARRD